MGRKSRQRKAAGGKARMSTSVEAGAPINESRSTSCRWDTNDAEALYTGKHCEVWLESVPEGYDVRRLVTSCLEILESVKEHVDLHLPDGQRVFNDCSTSISELSTYLFANGAYGWWYPAFIVASDNRFSKTYAFNDTSLGGFAINTEDQSADSTGLSLFDVEFPLITPSTNGEEHMASDEEPMEHNYEAPLVAEEHTPSSDPLVHESEESAAVSNRYPVSLVTSPLPQQAYTGNLNHASSSSSSSSGNDQVPTTVQGGKGKGEEQVGSTPWYRVSLLSPVPNRLLLVFIRSIIHILREVSIVARKNDKESDSHSSSTRRLSSSLAHALSTLDTFIKYVELGSETPAVTLVPESHIRPVQLDNPYYSSLAILHILKGNVAPQGSNDVPHLATAVSTVQPRVRDSKLHTDTISKENNAIDKVSRMYPWFRRLLNSSPNYLSLKEDINSIQGNNHSHSTRDALSPMLDFLFHPNCWMYHVAPTEDSTMSQDALSLESLPSVSLLPLPTIHVDNSIIDTVNMSSKKVSGARVRELAELFSLPVSLLYKRLSKVEYSEHSIHTPGMVGLPLRYYVRKHKFWRLFDHGVNMRDQPGKRNTLWKELIRTLGTLEKQSLEIGPSNGDTDNSTMNTMEYDIDPWCTVTPEAVAVYIADELLSSRDTLAPLSSESSGITPTPMSSYTLSFRDMSAPAPSDASTGPTHVLHGQRKYRFSWDFCSGIGSNAIHLWRMGQIPSNAPVVDAVFAVEYSLGRVLASLQNMRVYFREMLRNDPALYTPEYVNMDSLSPTVTSETQSEFTPEVSLFPMDTANAGMVRAVRAGIGKHRVSPLVWICGDMIPLLDALEELQDFFAGTDANIVKEIRRSFLRELLQLQVRRFLSVCFAVHSPDKEKGSSANGNSAKVSQSTDDREESHSVPSVFLDQIHKYIAEHWIVWKNDSPAGSVARSGSPRLLRHEEIHKTMELLSQSSVSITPEHCLPFAALVYLFPELSGLCGFVTTVEACSVLAELKRQYADSSTSIASTTSTNNTNNTSTSASKSLYLVDTAICSPPWGGPFYGLVAKEQFAGKYSLSQQLTISSSKTTPQEPMDASPTDTSSASTSTTVSIDGIDLISNLTRITRTKVCLYLPESSNRGEILQGIGKGIVSNTTSSVIQYCESQTKLTSEWYKDVTLFEFLENNFPITDEKSPSPNGNASLSARASGKEQSSETAVLEENITDVLVYRQYRGHTEFTVPSERFSQACEGAIVHFDEEEVPFPLSFRSSKWDRFRPNDPGHQGGPRRKKRREEASPDGDVDDDDDTEPDFADGEKEIQTGVGIPLGKATTNDKGEKRSENEGVSAVPVVRVEVQQTISDDRMLASCIFITKNTQ